MKNILQANKGFWTREHKRSMYLGLLLLILALMVQVGAGRYSARRAGTSNFVSDLFLDNLPTVDLDYVIVQGAIIVTALGILLFVYKPHYLLFGIKAVAIFLIIRSFFLDLTHIGIYPDNYFFVKGVGSRIYNTVNFNGNFFFSGHTGLPFLLALVFWREKFWRRFFIAVSVFFGASVLLAHVHYSIDVFAAPFITYGIYKIAAKIFPRDYVLTLGPSHHTSLKEDGG